MAKASPFSAMARFDEELLPALRQIRFFRLATAEEVDASYAAYETSRATGDAGILLDTWGRVAVPTRATLSGVAALIYESVGMLPQGLRRLAVLATLRAVLRAGERFRAGLSPEIALALHSEFPWLQNRHLHIPGGYAPRFEFPAAFATFLQGGSLDDARARWQLCAALNEVQQSIYSADMARRCRLPELLQQSEREAELARNYFAHFSPPATRELWRQCIVLLDALNAAVLAMTCSLRGPLIVAGSALASLRPGQRGGWRRFVSGLSAPQLLLLPPAPPTALEG